MLNEKSIFLVIIALSLVGCAYGSLSQSKPLRPLVIGHRGASGYRPEHTRLSYELAIDQGADFIEPDLVPTKDYVLIARHENELSETTDVATRFPSRKTTKVVDGQSVTGWFAEDFTLAEIKTLRAKERLRGRSHVYDGGEEILTFDEVVAIAQKAVRPVGLCPELKHPTYFRQRGYTVEKLLLQSLERAGLNRGDSLVIVQSAELSALQTLHERSAVKLLWLIDDLKIRPFDHVIVGDARTYGEMLRPESLRHLSSWLYALGPFKRLILPEGKDGKLISPTRLIKDAHETGLKVFAYTFRSDPPFLAKDYMGDAVQEYRQFYGLGVDGVFSDFPDHAIKARN